MSGSNWTISCYQSVIDDVAARVKPEFVQEGVDESVLEELRALWEAKLIQTGVLGGRADNAPPTQPLGGPHPFLPRQLPPGTMLPLQYAAMGLRMPTQPGVMPAIPGAPHGFQFAMPIQQPRPHMAIAAPAMTAASAAVQHVQLVADRKRQLEAASQPPAKHHQLSGPPPTIGQQDGADDDGVEDAAADQQAGSSEGEDELNEADDLAGVDDDEVDEDAVANVVLGQFEKVQRSKSKWKVILKDCVATVEGKDYLLRRATGEMNF